MDLAEPLANFESMLTHPKMCFNPRYYTHAVLSAPVLKLKWIKSYIISFFDNLICSKCCLASDFNDFASSKCVVEDICIHDFSWRVVYPWVNKIFSISNHPLCKEFQFFQKNTKIVSDNFNVSIIVTISK